MGYVAYTADSLAQELRGIVNSSPNTPAGSVPDKVMKIVHFAGIKLWDKVDWEFRRITATLTLADATAEQDAPNDFAKFDQKWLRETDDGTGLKICSDVRRYQSLIEVYTSTDTGTPAVMTAITESSSAPHKWKFIWQPKCDEEYTFPYWYLRSNPWQRATSPLNDTTAPNWPMLLDEGWKLLATMGVLGSYYPGTKTAKGAADTFKDWLADAKGNMDEIVSGDEEETISAGYDDVSAFASSVMGLMDTPAHSGSIRNSWGAW